MANRSSTTDSDVPASAHQDLVSTDGALSLIEIAKSCTEFTCFPELPPELRLKIWTEVCQQAHVVNTRLRFKKGYMIAELLLLMQTENGEAYSLLSPSGIPAILAVAVEARLVGLEHYSPAFTTRFITYPGDHQAILTSLHRVLTSTGQLILSAQPGSLEVSDYQYCS
jgi:hypothetical protein